MKNVESWINSFKGFSSKNQLLVASEIVNKLSENENNLEKDHYDQDMSEEIRDLLNIFIENSTTSDKIEDFKRLLLQFGCLDYEKKLSIMDSVSSLLHQFISEQQKENIEAICESSGHIFSDWKYYTWTESGRVTDSRATQEWIKGKFEVERREWRRICSRCGFVEVTEFEPEEIRTKRLVKEKIEQIQILKKELKELENK